MRTKPEIPFPQPRWPMRGLAGILGAYLVIGTLYAALTPRWQVPDEPAHYNYIRQLAAGRLPVLEDGDYDQAALSRLTAGRFPPELPIDRLEYEDHQPPLYYLLVVPHFLVFDGALFPLRWFSVWLGAGVVLGAFLVGRQVLPKRPVVALTAAGFVAFLPQHVAILAGVNNDGLAGLILGLTLLLVLRYVETRPAPPRGYARETEAWKIGVLLGLGFLTKGTIVFLPLVALAALLLVWRRESWSLRHASREALAMFLPALLLGGAWWARNVWVYGWPDIFGQLRHNAVVDGQPRTVEWLAELGWGEYLLRIAVTTFNSFWGQFGWMGVVMDRRVYLVLLAFTAVAAAGFGLALADGWRRPAPPSSDRRAAFVLLALVAAGSLLLYVAYNVTFVQHQGRYLFPALIPIALAVSLGLDRLARFFGFLGRWAEWLPLALLPFLAALDLFALFRFILPALAA